MSKKEEKALVKINMEEDKNQGMENLPKMIYLFRFLKFFNQTVLK